MKINIKYFNMVEVVLALGVLAIGFTAVMGLFPTGLKAAKDSVTLIKVSDAADTLETYLKLAYNNDDAGHNDWPDASGPNAGPNQWYGDAITATKPEPAKTITPINPAKLGTDFLFATSTDNVYYVKMGDVNALVGVWREPIKDMYSIKTGGLISSGEAAKYLTRVHMEFSWPAALDYAKREKKEFVFEMLNNR